MGVTPNRGYPYPDALSDMRITTDLRDLAEAFDTDLKSVQDTVEQRPMFRATAESTFFMGTSNPVDLPFDVLEENNGGALLEPITMPRTTFIPLIAGLWSFTATVSYRQQMLVSMASIELVSTFPIMKQSVNVLPNIADGNRTLSVTGFAQMSGTGTGNSIRAEFELNAGAPTTIFRLFSRSLTGILLARD